MALLPRRSLSLVALVLVLAGLLVGGACSKSGSNVEKKGGGPEAKDSPTAAAVAPPPQFAIAGIDVQATAAPDDATVAAVKQTLDEWLATALVAPLRSGQPAGDLSAVFTTDALARLADPATRATLVDEGLPPATSSVSAETATVVLASVAGPDGAVALIAARIDLKLRVTGAGLDVDIVREGEMVLAPEADRWKIESFAIRTTRDSRNDPATPTTAAP